ncbi:expansin-like protein [Gelatoporia subvermispora B]|uniref:Expansin-like protein n=1 Tax=Ceriporiopsis subvermispora (strain B) TaxID=914234 RepID=M2R2A8_CERS8|nr:expansin-like protein [Gelatoporia subvermispora B]
MKTIATSVLAFAFFVASAAAQSGHGTLFDFNPSLGACGFTNTSDQLVAAVSSDTFHSFPGSGSNPNNNPICHHTLTVSHDGKSVTAQIVDFLGDEPAGDVGLSPAAFSTFAPPSQGVVQDVYWVIN